jgi:hypothetical protein
MAYLVLAAVKTFARLALKGDLMMPFSVMMADTYL